MFILGEYTPDKWHARKDSNLYLVVLETTILPIKLQAYIWCAKWDLNPHFSRNQILSLTRLPIPPFAHKSGNLMVYQPGLLFDSLVEGRPPLAPPAGFEPTVYGLTVRRVTLALWRNMYGA